MSNKVIYSLELKKKTNWIFTFFISLWLIALIGIIGTIIYGICENPERLKDFIFVLIVITLIGLWIFDKLLWQIKGIEEIKIDNKILLQKKGKLYKTINEIEFLELEKILFDNDNQTSFISKNYWLKGGRIIIKYLDKEVRIGQDISIDTAERIVSEISRNIRKTKSYKT